MTLWPGFIPVLSNIVCTLSNTFDRIMVWAFHNVYHKVNRANCIFLMYFIYPSADDMISGPWKFTNKQTTV